MAYITTLTTFVGGLISRGRVDDAAYQNSVDDASGMIITPQGAAASRPGFEFVNEVKYSDKYTRLIRFVFSNTQTVVIEVGAGYFRFHTDGGTITQDGVQPYEISSPYYEDDLAAIHYASSRDVMTLTHPNYAPRELRRYGVTDWRLETIAFSPPILPPTGVTATPDSGTEPKYLYIYVVTAVDDTGLIESVKSATASAQGNLFATGGTVTINWDSVTGAARYRVYKLQGGIFGRIGETDELSIVDDNISPDVDRTPPLYEAVFDAPGKYPAAVGYYEQRRVFAGTYEQPQTIWMTRSGTETNMSYTFPPLADNRATFRVSSQEASSIRHVVSLSQLLVLTSSTEWQVAPVSAGPLLATEPISVRPQSYIGATNVQPVLVNNTLIYGAARGGHIIELAYNWQAGGYVTGDLCLRAPHLFDGKEIIDMAYGRAPFPIIWGVSSTGDLLGITYIPEQEVGAWHKHPTDGTFESIAVVPEGVEDRVYAIIKRNIGGQLKRYIERMGEQGDRPLEEMFRVDSGLTYRGPPTRTILNLGHLEGREVRILADGAVMRNQTVLNGSITIEEEASIIHVGLEYRPRITPLPPVISMKGGGYAQGRPKNVNKVYMNVRRSSGIFVWQGEELEEEDQKFQVEEYKQRTTETPGTPPRLQTELIEIPIKGNWDSRGIVTIEQRDPLPLTVVDMTIEFSMGG